MVNKIKLLFYVMIEFQSLEFETKNLQNLASYDV